MKTEKAVAFYGSKAEVSRVLGCNRSQVTRWGKVIPINRALRLVQLTGGKLKLELDDYRD
jgi:hypothetical protein